ncbi:IS4 family transposase, partial [uncultured Nostoc sp.]|uniref:IS4 family transposase n=1 Tax=uncultured Nostoc sp. TaxID=340711 RepID=UPI0035CCA86F
MTAEIVAEYDVVLCVGDTTFLDYGSIEAKKEGYGPIGKGGNGLILHSALAIEPMNGQSLGLLWQKLWNREPKRKPPKDETPTQKKKRQTAARKEARNRPFEQKESYKWVEALTTVENLASQHTQVIHVFDREGDITEVFDQLRQQEHTGIIVRAAHNRSLDSESERLWSKLEAQPISFEQEIELPQTSQRTARKTKLAIRFCLVNLRIPYRFDNRNPLSVYTVYATKVDCPEGEIPIEWMLLTTEVIADIEMASMVLRWYSYRWRVEEYHKVFKSGCQVEKYRLAAEGMKTLIGFLSVIAVELLGLTYLHRTQPLAPAIEILNPLELKILKAKSPKPPKVLTVNIKSGESLTITVSVQKSQ